jgi:hypothetical protein
MVGHWLADQQRRGKWRMEMHFFLVLENDRGGLNLEHACLRKVANSPTFAFYGLL